MEKAVICLRRGFSIPYVGNLQNHVISVETYMNEVTIVIYLVLLKLEIFVYWVWGWKTCILDKAFTC